MYDETKFTGMVICTKYERMEFDIDVYIKVIERKIWVKLLTNIYKLNFQTNALQNVVVQIVNATFPNLIIARHWYKPMEKISALNIRTCNFTSIAVGAFDNDALEDLEVLSFHGNPSFEYKNGQFIGMPRLSLFVFTKGNIYNITKDFTLHLCGFLTNLLIINFTESRLNFNIIFGSYTFLRLRHITIENVPDLHTLAYSNFTGMKTIKYLFIRNCGVQLILANAFDYICVTLEWLDLTGNQLKTLPFEIFHQFLEWNPSEFRAIGLTENAWNYDCNMLELIHVISMCLLPMSKLPHISSWNQFKKESMKQMAKINLSVSNCTNLQTIRTARLCLDKDQIDAPAFAKIILKLGSSYVCVTSTKPRRMRLWMVDSTHDDNQFSMKNQKCPKYNWLRSNTKCVKLNDSTKFSLPKFHAHWRLEFRTICLNYIASNRRLQFWPLNCLTYRKNETNWDDEPRNYLLAIISGLFCLLCGVSTGGILSIMYARFRRENILNVVADFAAANSEQLKEIEVSMADIHFDDCNSDYISIEHNSGYEPIDQGPAIKLSVDDLNSMEIDLPRDDYGYVVLESSGVLNNGTNKTNNY